MACPLYSALVMGRGPDAILLLRDRETGEGDIIPVKPPAKAPATDGLLSALKPLSPAAKDGRRDEGWEEVIA